MDNTPIFNPSDQQAETPYVDDEAPTRGVRLAILGFGLVVCCAFSAFGFIRYQSNVVSFYESFFPTPTATFTPTQTPTHTATFTPTLNLPATRAFNATNTALAFEATASHAASEWQEIFSETFDNNSHRWDEYTIDTGYAKSKSKVEDSKYRWEAVAQKGFIDWVPFPIKSLDDFFLSLEVSLGDHTGSNDYGIIFRRDAQGNFYYFAIDSDHMYSLFKYYAGGWTALIDRTPSSVIKKEEPNRLTIIAEGDHFILFINDHFVAGKHDDWIEKGTVALAIEIFEPDQEATFEFDNIVLRTK